mmetsp:Transcript_120119/g.218305  ORF Transcript_120119/g.218305 Transcript_120119/m.218305 type:complete len:396 (-) Transcript_120119:340-1527(-)
MAVDASELLTSMPQPGRPVESASGKPKTRRSLKYSAGGTRYNKPASNNAIAGESAAVDASRRVFQPYHSVSVPKKRDLEVGYNTQKDMTTVMLRNIPNKYTCASLLQEIDCLGFAGAYNFFYLPMDIHNRTNVGYAFINFSSPADMSQFIHIFTDYKFKRHQSQKIARVSPAHIQGFLENVSHFSNCAVTRSRNCHYRPLVRYHSQLRDLAEVLLELASSVPIHFPGADRMLCPEVLAALESGATMSMHHVARCTPSGLNPEAAEFVPGGFVSEEVGATVWSSVPYSKMDPSALEFYPDAPLQLPPGLETVADNVREASPQDAFDSKLGDDTTDSWGMAKKGLEQALSMWLQEKKVTDTQSTEGGDSGAGSGSITPRSASDKVVASDKEPETQFE